MRTENELKQELIKKIQQLEKANLNVSSLKKKISLIKKKLKQRESFIV